MWLSKICLDADEDGVGVVQTRVALGGDEDGVGLGPGEDGVGLGQKKMVELKMGWGWVQVRAGCR